MFSLIYFVFALASAHAYTTIVQKGGNVVLKGTPKSSHSIPAGQCSAILNSDQLQCGNAYQPWAPSTLQVVVDDDGGYPEISIRNDLLQAEIHRSGCDGTAYVSVYEQCYYGQQQGGQPWGAGSRSPSPKFGPNYLVLSETKN